MKKHNLLKVLLIVIFLLIVASWFIPGTIVSSGKFNEIDVDAVGLFSLADYFSYALQVFCNIPILILSIGGLYGVLHKIPQYRMLLDKIVDGFEDREWIFMVIIGVSFALLSSLAGLSLPLLVLFPFVISVILLMGYDKVTAAMLTVGSVIAGLIGTVFSNVGIAGAGFTYSTYDVDTIVSSGLELITFSANGNVLFKLLLLVLGLGLVLINTIKYSEKHKDKKNLIKGDFIPEKAETNNKSFIPIVVVLDLLLIVIALSFISWDVFNISLFSDMTKNFLNPTGNIMGGVYGALSTILGVTEYSVFGNWNLLEVSSVVFLASIIIAIIYRKSLDSYLNAFTLGVKKAIIPALIVSVSFMIIIISFDVPVHLTLLKGILDLDGGVNIATMSILALVYSIFLFDPFFILAVGSTYVSAVATASTIGLAGLIWQSMYGVAMLIAPTSVVLLATLSYLDISYTKWMKSIWRLLLELLGVVFIVLLLV